MLLLVAGLPAVMRLEAERVAGLFTRCGRRKNSFNVTPRFFSDPASAPFITGGPNSVPFLQSSPCGQPSAHVEEGLKLDG